MKIFLQGRACGFGKPTWHLTNTGGAGGNKKKQTPSRYASRLIVNRKGTICQKPIRVIWQMVPFLDYS